MPIGDILIKLSKGQTLSLEEQGDLRIWGNQTELNNSYVDGLKVGSSQMQNIIISNPHYVTSALNYAYLERTTDTAITTGVDTYITFEAARGEFGPFRWDSADPTKIFMRYPGQGFEVRGYVGWDANATGYRNLKLEGFTVANVSIGNAVLHAFPGFAGSDNVFPFTYGVFQNQFTNLSYVKFSVGHTKGSDLNLLYFNLGISVL